MQKSNIRFPFHATQSEQRILRDLITLAALREKRAADEHFVKDLFSQLGATTGANAVIAALQEQLFPLETQLRHKRAEFLHPLQTSASRAHFDQTLETDEIGMTVKIRNAEDYAAFKTALLNFDYSAWQRLCEGERVDAD